LELEEFNKSAVIKPVFFFSLETILESKTELFSWSGSRGPRLNALRQILHWPTFVKQIDVGTLALSSSLMNQSTLVSSWRCQGVTTAPLAKQPAIFSETVSKMGRQRKARRGVQGKLGTARTAATQEMGRAPHEPR
jgi:hypothetical protein